MVSHTHPIARAMAAGAIVGALMLGGPSQTAAQTNSAPSAAPPSDASPPATPRPKAQRRKISPSERLEARIADLHSRLAITAAQEGQWNDVAQAMRDSAKSMEAAINSRTEKLGTMSAVDDLRSYESLAEVHAEGMKKLVAAFAPLYDSMSETQKKTADTVFRQHERHISSAKKQRS